MSFSYFIGEYNEINWPIFENEHGIHYPSPSAIAKFWIGIKNPKELIIGLRHDANWIESKLEENILPRITPLQLRLFNDAYYFNNS